MRTRSHAVITRLKYLSSPLLPFFNNPKTANRLWGRRRANMALIEIHPARGTWECRDFMSLIRIQEIKRSGGARTCKRYDSYTRICTFDMCTLTLIAFNSNSNVLVDFQKIRGCMNHQSKLQSHFLQLFFKCIRHHNYLLFITKDMLEFLLSCV